MGKISNKFKWVLDIRSPENLKKITTYNIQGYFTEKYNRVTKQ